MSEVLSGWSPARATESPLGDRYCVVAPELAAGLLTEHAEVFEVAAYDTKFGREALTRDIPNVADEVLASLDDQGLVRVGTSVAPGDVLVGKVTPKSDVASSPEEKALRAMFGELAGEVRDTSLRMPPGLTATVTAAARIEPREAGELERAAITVAWTRPLEVGDVLVDRQGHRAVVAAIRPVAGGLAFGGGGPVEVAKVALARDVVHARSIGPYSLVTQQPLSKREQFGGQAVSAPQLAALARAAPWTAWELLTLKSDCVAGRTRAYEDLVMGRHPGRRKPAEPATGDIFSYFARPSERRGDDRVYATVPESVQVAEQELAALGLEVVTDRPPLKARWFTSDEIRARSHGEVKKPETINYRTFAPEADGLFCARVFGPVHDYECLCGAYRGLKHRGLTCEQCGVEVVQSRVRRERQGHIALSVPIPHPWRLGEVAAHLGSTVAEVRRRIDGEQADVVPLAQALAGTDLLLDALPVLPPDLRPLVPLDAGRFATSDLNDLYRRVVNRNNRTRRLVELGAPELIVRNEIRMLFEAVESLMDNAYARVVLTGPDRRQLVSLADSVASHLGPTLLAKRSDYSGVAHLSVDPNLDDGVCRLPRSMARELFKPWAYAMLEAWGHATTIKQAKRLVESEAPAALHAIRGVAERWPVLLVTDRALAGCRVEVGDGAAIVVAPDLAARLASEVVQLFVPLGAQACAEVRDLGVVELTGTAPVEVSGWFSALAAGADVEASLREGLTTEDAVDDPAIRVALGWWPGPGGDEVPWLAPMLDSVTPFQ